MRIGRTKHAGVPNLMLLGNETDDCGDDDDDNDKQQTPAHEFELGALAVRTLHVRLTNIVQCTFHVILGFVSVIFDLDCNSNTQEKRVRGRF